VVSVTSTRRTSSVAPRPAVSPQNAERAFLSKWLRIWVGLLTVVTLVVVVYLTFITNSLANINGNLGTVSREVAAAGTNVEPLTNHVDRKPIPGQAGQIVGALDSINGKLANTDASLQDTAAALQTVLGTVGQVNGVLIDANEPGDNLGVQDIHQRIARINGRNSPAVAGASAGGTPGPFGTTPGNLADARADAARITGQLDAVNGSLLGTCRGLVVGLLSGVLGGLLGGGGGGAGCA
jgi:hypothetical protein